MAEILGPASLRFFVAFGALMALSPFKGSLSAISYLGNAGSVGLHNFVLAYALHLERHCLLPVFFTILKTTIGLILATTPRS